MEAALRSLMCPICGTPFTTTHGTKIYCTVACSERAHKKKNYDQSRARYIAKRRRAEALLRAAALSEICAAARAAGMTYGQYTAAQRCGALAGR